VTSLLALIGCLRRNRSRSLRLCRSRCVCERIAVSAIRLHDSRTFQVGRRGGRLPTFVFFVADGQHPTREERKEHDRAMQHGWTNKLPSRAPPAGGLMLLWLSSALIGATLPGWRSAV